MQPMVNPVFQEGSLLFFVHTKCPTNLAFGWKNCDLVEKCPTVISSSELKHSLPARQWRSQTFIFGGAKRTPKARDHLWGS
jgi:hypothetical protein